ncbi:MAG: hypothetical protein N2035_04905 [Chthoniobacterales bacterium]|nr:hypothetical protein [Chthoniobacterales bacterium]
MEKNWQRFKSERKLSAEFISYFLPKEGDPEQNVVQLLEILKTNFTSAEKKNLAFSNGSSLEFKKVARHFDHYTASITFKWKGLPLWVSEIKIGRASPLILAPVGLEQPWFLLLFVQ